MVIPLPPRRRVATLLIDNYDSYTFNIYQMLAQVNGLAPVVIKNDAFGGDWQEAWKFFLSSVYGQQEEGDVQWPSAEQMACNVVISPGPGHPAERTDFGMCANAIRLAPVPVLGVCLGHQGLATVYGGQVSNAPEVMHGRTSRVAYEPSSEEGAPLFAHIPNGFEVVRYHSLAIDEATFPSGELRVLARSSGDGVIMAVQHRAKPQFGVQFHPEAVCSSFGFQLFQNFRDITLVQPASKCALVHSAHPDSTALGGVPSVKGDSVGALSERSKYQVSVQRVRTGLATLEFAEFAFDKLFGASKRSFWLDSSNFDATASTRATQSRFSIMGDNSGPLSYCVEYSVLDKSLRVHRRSNAGSSTLADHDILTHMREQMAEFRDHRVAFWERSQQGAAAQDHERDASDIPFAFRGGFVGYFGYEVIGSGVHGSDPTGPAVIKRALEQRKREGDYVPDASFIFADRALVFDHLDGNVYSLAVNQSGADHVAASREWHRSIADQLRSLVQRFTQDEGSSANGTVSSAREPVVFFPSRSREQYGRDIAQIQQLIHDGETYEVCLTNQLRASCGLHDPLGFYKLLRKRNPAPYAGFYLSNPSGAFASHGHDPNAAAMTDSYAICCSSPERFLRVGRDGWMESKPIKGTRRRGRSASEDAVIAQELAECVKDRAENMMIADLVRNDFGVVAQIGSVHVPALMAVESYKTVHQLVTTVRGKKRQDADLVDILHATFPGGSMTGAPKKRTMQIIRQLEQAPRGVYSGALGFLSLDGSCDLSIIIRTAVVTPRSVSLGAGGAIVAMSDTEDEYEEMLLKARALVQAVGCFVTGRDDGTGARVETKTVA